MKDIIERVLREQGLDDNGASPHGWRCQHPDRFPDYCTCVSDAVQAIAAELEAAGYRMTSMEHTALMPLSSQPRTIDENTFPPEGIAATHRRRVYRGPWELVPDDEPHPASSMTFGDEP